MGPVLVARRAGAHDVDHVASEGAGAGGECCQPAGRHGSGEEGAKHIVGFVGVGGELAPPGIEMATGCLEGHGAVSHAKLS